MSAGVSSGLAAAVQSTAGIGTPHARWREMHQSGRFVTMLKIRSRPQRRDPLHLMVDGVPRRLAQRPRLPSSPAMTASPSSRTNHCEVARKITGLWQRQQCGYWCSNVSAVPEPAALVQRLLDVRVGVEHALAAEQLDGVEEVPARTDRRVDVEAVLHAGQEVVGAMAGRGVDGARALLERDVVGEHADRIALVERMPEPDALELLALHPRERAIERPADRLGRRVSASPSATITARPVDVVGARSRTPDGTRSPGSTESSTASSSR